MGHDRGCYCFRPGFPGVPPFSSLDELWWFELPGSQPSGPLPTPWLHLPRSWPVPLPFLPAQPTTVVPVIVTSPTPEAPAYALPSNVPRVSVIAAPARMLPMKCESVSVAAASTHHVTLQAVAPPARTTEKFVPVSAPGATLKTHVPLAGPLSVNVPVFASALTQ